MTRTRVFLTRLARAVWFRATLFSIGALALALAAGIAQRFLPALAINLGQGSLDQILQILATSMLAVTTFSLTAMVTAYSSASQGATPRASQLLVADPTAQNVLSTFIGAFVFSMVGIVALSTGYYGPQGQAILFLGTLAVIVIVVVVLLRWIAHLGSFGRMADVIDRVEDAACSATGEYARRPSLGARVQDPDAVHGVPVFSRAAGYVTHIELDRLQSAAQSGDVLIHVRALPGALVDTRSPLAVVEGAAEAVADGADGDSLRAAISGAFHIEPHRSYEQDPRLGVIALSEIASRALSPSTNDPGTAIDVLGALARVFESILRTQPDPEVVYSRVTVLPVSLADLAEDAFRPIARDGAGMVEVGIRLQKTLAALARLAGGPDRRVFTDAAADARQRAARVLPPEDLDAIVRAARPTSA